MRKKLWKRSFQTKGDVSHRIIGKGGLLDVGGIALHQENYPLINLPWLFYIFSKRFGEFHSIAYGKGSLGNEPNQNNLTENTGLFYFSPNLRAFTGLGEEIHGCPCVSLGKPVYMLLGHVF
jgi:hypothetical protein